MDLAAIPSPAQGVWHIGPLAIRAYALCIVAGIIVAWWLTDRRLRARGAPEGLTLDILLWAVPFGVLGGRIYHVLTSYELYFGEGENWVNAFKIQNGGLGIWGAVLLGAVGAWIPCRKRGVPLSLLGDALAPGLALAQAIGRWGNWFNQELFGRPTSVPWAVRIDPGQPDTVPGATTYHPTFLYESLWCIGIALVLLWAERRWGLGRGRVFALYVMLYVLGRFWIEGLRIDDAHTFAGLRLNQWVSIIVFAGAAAYFFRAKGAPQRLKVAENGTITVVNTDPVLDALGASQLATPTQISKHLD